MLRFAFNASRAPNVVLTEIEPLRGYAQQIETPHKKQGKVSPPSLTATPAALSS